MQTKVSKIIQIIIKNTFSRFSLLFFIDYSAECTEKSFRVYR